MVDYSNQNLPTIKEVDASLGIEFIKIKFGEEFDSNHVDGPKLISFFTYLTNTLLKRFPVQLWNINDLLGDVDLINRTNNPCESFNRRLNSLLPASPKLVQLVDIIRDEFALEETYMENRRSGVDKVPEAYSANANAIPTEFNLFLFEKVQFCFIIENQD